MTTVAISLNDEDQHFLEEAVKSGRYFSESEVVAEALSEFNAADVKADGRKRLGKQLASR